MEDVVAQKISRIFYSGDNLVYGWGWEGRWWIYFVWMNWERIWLGMIWHTGVRGRKNLASIIYKHTYSGLSSTSITAYRIQKISWSSTLQLPTSSPSLHSTYKVLSLEQACRLPEMSRIQNQGCSIAASASITCRDTRVHHAKKYNYTCIIIDGKKWRLEVTIKSIGNRYPSLPSSCLPPHYSFDARGSAKSLCVHCVGRTSQAI